MRMDKLTSKFQLALADAQSLAVGMDHQLIEPDHVMVALLDQEGGSIRHLLTRAGVKVNALRSQLGERLDALPKISGAAGVLGHLIIADHVTITAMSLVTKNISKSGVYSSGTPLLSNSLWHRANVRYKGLDNLALTVAKLDKTSK